MSNDILKAFEFEGNNVTFFDKNGTLYINATEMAKPFSESKKPSQWLRTSSAKEYIGTVAEVQKCTSADLQRVSKGGNAEQGTWFQKDVALEFARWLSPKFALWCNQKIEELLTQGHAELKPAVKVPTTMKEALIIALELQEQNEQQQKMIATMQPKVNYCDLILSSPSLTTVTSIAQDYGMSAVKFNEMLEDFGVQYNSGGQWILYAKYKASGYVMSESIAISTDKKRRPIVKTYTKWTQEGRKFLYEMLKTRGVIPVVERQTC